MRIFLFAAILLASLACSSSGKKLEPSEADELINGRPKWVTQPSLGCQSFQLCAVGEGSGFSISEVNARKELAKIFETKVTGSTIIQTDSESTSDVDGPLSSSIREDVANRVEEYTEQALDGVEIIRKFEAKEGYYAQAALDKRAAADRLRSRMRELDEKITDFYQDGKRSSLYKALKLFSIRSKLNARHEFLQGSRFPAGTKYGDVLAKMRAKRALGTTVFVRLEEVVSSGEVRHLVIQQLLDLGYKVVTDQSRNHQYRVHGELVREKQHLNVRGFEKYKFILQLKSANNEGRKIGSLNYQETQVGRQFVQAYAKALPGIRHYIVENLGELNID